MSELRLSYQLRWYNAARWVTDGLAHVFWRASYFMMRCSFPFQRCSLRLTARIDPVGVEWRRQQLSALVETNEIGKDAW